MAVRQVKRKSRKTTAKPKSKVNQAGNYTKPRMRETLFKRIKAGKVYKCSHNRLY